MKYAGKRRMQRLLAVLVMFAILAAILPMNVRIQAAKKSDLTLNEKKVTLKSGETVKLKVASRSYKKDLTDGGYWSSADQTIASVSDTGKVTALASGTTIITYRESYWDQEGVHDYTAECKVTVKKGKYALKKHSLTMIEGESKVLTVPNDVKVSFESYGMEGFYSDIYVTNDDETGEAIVHGDYPETAYVLVKFMDEKKHLICADRCKVTVLRRGIDTRMVSLAVGKSYQFAVNGYTEDQIVSWTSDNEAVATVSKSGKLKAIGEGSAEVILTVYEMDEYGEEYTRDFTCEVYVSHPVLTSKEQNLALGYSMEYPVKGTSDYSVIEMTSSKPGIVEANGTYLYARAKGTAVITMMVDGVKLKTTIRVTDPKVKEALLPIVKGKSKKITLTGINSHSNAVYTTTNKKVATVSKSGKVKGLKNGTATITVTVDGVKLYVPVSVSNEKVVKTLNFAVDAIGTPYSQANRMSAGYFDCSSLAWRSYHSAGVDFGASGWAPTAAGLAEYLVNHKKAVAYEALSWEQLKPGDLLFFAKENNGRYKNIYHVAVYAGAITKEDNYWYGDSSGYTTGLLLEARNEGVGLFEYWPEARNVVVVGRPTR